MIYDSIKYEHKLFRLRGIGPSGEIDTNPPVNLTLPFVQPEYGTVYDLVICSAGDWLEARQLFYQWHRDGVPIFGSDNDRYSVRIEDQGKYLTCLVTAKNSLGSTSVMSSNSCYVADDAHGSLLTDFLLLEEGHYILLEDDTKILLE